MPRAVERDRSLHPQAPEQGDLLLDALAPVLEAHAERVELDPVPADPDAEPEPASGQNVERRGLLRDERGLALREDEHAGRELESRGDRRGEREEDHDLVERRLDGVWTGPPWPRGIGAEDVVVRDEPIETHGLDVADERRDDRRIVSDLGLREDRMKAHLP
jgi:hypothetical protein